MKSKPLIEIKLDLDKVQAASQSERFDFRQTKPSQIIESGLGFLFIFVNWIWVVLMLVIVGTVSMRYFIGGNTVWIEETQWHLFAVGFMFSIGAAVVYDSHIRVDVLSSQFRVRTRAWIELLMILLIIFPLCWLMIQHGYTFAERAWRLGERSSNVGGLTHRWAIKSVILLAFVVIGLASLARLLKVTSELFGLPRAINRR